MFTNLKKNFSKGFSIVELLVVIALLTVITVVATSILYTSLGSSTKASGLEIVKQNGDQAIQFLERRIREAKEVSCVDLGGGNWELQVTDRNYVVTNFRTVYDSTNGVNRLAYGGSTYLTSAELNATAFSCAVISAGVGDPDVVAVSFTLQMSPGGRPSEAVVETFRTRTSLRTY
jgi:prepilin-type N-terminal cleavage/methylation domain-containing protein